MAASPASCMFVAMSSQPLRFHESNLWSTPIRDLGLTIEGLSLDDSLRPAAELIRRLEPELMANVFRWTGHFPERTRMLLRYLADRAVRLGQGYPADREESAIMALTTLVTGLAMNHVQRGSYLP
jgi:hypothetical protein